MPLDIDFQKIDLRYIPFITVAVKRSQFNRLFNNFHRRISLLKVSATMETVKPRPITVIVNRFPLRAVT